MRHTSVSPLTEAQLQGTHYGLQLYELDAIEDILSANVEYLKPRGGNSEPFRLTDFYRIYKRCYYSIRYRVYEQ